MVKFLAVSNFENSILKRSKGLASCRCCSVISKLFQKHHTVFKIFVNFVIRKFLHIWYTVFLPIQDLRF